MPCAVRMPSRLWPPYRYPGPPAYHRLNQLALISSRRSPAKSILLMHSQTADTSTCPTQGAKPQAAGNWQLRTVPSGTVTRTGRILPSLHGTSQKSVFVSAIVTWAKVLGRVELVSLGSLGLVPEKSR